MKSDARGHISTGEARRQFLEYFEQKGHRVVGSSPVIPHGDPTLLFTNAGMNQFKDTFIGRETREYKRAVTVQKCIRAGGKHNDLDNVGYTARHLTFFEMLGNFSFGDYFKADAIAFAWELLTEGYGLDPDQLWVTVYRDDREARQIWRKEIGVPAGRIVGLGKKDNYWSMGDVGPCGPCSEILFDRGERHSCGPKCGIGSCDCDRFFEIWNLVFMQYDQLQDGKKVPLPRPSIDTGMGLERLAMVLQNVDSVFEIDLMRRLIQRVEELTGSPYSPGEEGVPHRVLADHVRSLVFAVTDGAEPSNEGRGYVMRRILRRAARYGRKLHSSQEPLLARLAESAVDLMGDAFGDLRRRAPYVIAIIGAEEERFNRTLDEGIQRFEEVVAELKKRGDRTIPGSEAFFLYDTCGFPLDLVERMAKEIGFSVDVAGYEDEMGRQKERSRGSARFKSAPEGGRQDILAFPPTHFVGYESDRSRAELMSCQRRDDRWEVVLSHTPFYAESGGQVGDTGVIRGKEFLLRVEDARKHEGRTIHLVEFLEGNPEQIRTGSEVAAEIDVARRQAIQRNHTATHLLHAALREVVGEHVHQKGSLVDASRLRFDVSHFKGIGQEERERVEELVARAITRNDPVETQEMDHGEAVKMGAMALFGEKYGDRVRVVKIGDFSMELCGGTHVGQTGEIGSFGLVSEGSVSSGVRRLEALTAEAAQRGFQQSARLIAQLSSRLKCPPDALVERVEKLLKAKDSSRKSGMSTPRPSGPPEQVDGLEVEKIPVSGGELQLVSGVVPGLSQGDLLDLYDRHKGKNVRTAAVLLAPGDRKVQVLVALTTALTEAGADAREVFGGGAEAIAARGGGRPQMVRGSGSRPEGARKALEAMLGNLKAFFK